jgi:threonine dehydrogenase-like Zn-dependent dehydrogenase
MITHRFPLDELDTALSTLETSKGCGKVLITFD